MDCVPNVSRPETAEEQSSGEQLALFVRVLNRDYRSVVAQIVKEIKAETGKTNETLAEDGHCSETTIANAENQNGNMDPVILLNVVGNNGGERRFKRVIRLLNGAPARTETVADKRRRLIRELASLEDQ